MTYSFVGFDGTENKRILLGLDAVKKSTGTKDDLDVLTRLESGVVDSETQGYGADSVFGPDPGLVFDSVFDDSVIL